MWSLLVLCLAAGDAVSEAGTVYREALVTLEAQNYEEGVDLLKKALQRLGEESENLKYRDATARRQHSYYPYYEWGRARLLQSAKETSVYKRRDYLQDAVGRLGQTQHPGAVKLLEDARTQLKSVEESIALDGSFQGVKTRIELLGNGENFVEALRLLEETAVKYRTRDKEIDDLRVLLREKQAAVIVRYGQQAGQKLSDVAVTDPFTSGDSIVPLLKGALIPAAVTPDPGAAFAWLRKFIDAWGKESEFIRRAAELKGDEVIASAGRLDALALEALGVNLDQGFRAARHLAHAGRMAKLRDIATGSQDVIDLETTATVVKSLLDGVASSREAVGRSGVKGDARTRLEAELGAHEKQGSDLDQLIRNGSKERQRLTAPIVRAEGALADGETMGDMAALTKIKNELFDLESEANFGTLTGRLRARALFAHAIAEAMLGFLEAAPVAKVNDRCLIPARRAYGFDKAVDARWAERLSPKIQKMFEKLKPD